MKYVYSRGPFGPATAHELIFTNEKIRAYIFVLHKKSRIIIRQVRILYTKQFLLVGSC